MIDAEKIAQDAGLVLNPTMSAEDVFDGNDVCPISGEPCICSAGQDLIGSNEPICCPASLLCTPAYLEDMNVPDTDIDVLDESEPSPEAPPRRDDILEGPSPEEREKLKAMKLQDLFDEVQALVDIEDYVGALDRIQRAMEKEDCELCLTTLMAEATRIATVANVCDLPNKSACEKEKVAFNDRFRDRLMELTEVVNEIGAFTPETKPKSPFRLCISASSLSDEQLRRINDTFLESKRHAVEHGIKSRMCGQSKSAFEEALQFMKDSHPDWLTLEGAQ
jgi:hypothetical protein